MKTREVSFTHKLNRFDGKNKSESLKSKPMCRIEVLPFNNILTLYMPLTV